MTTNHITLPREQQLAEELGFWIEEVAGVWLHREPDDRDREATLSERVLWSELLAAHPVEGDVPDSFAARWLTNGASLHPLTVNLVVRFARALASKLSAAEKKYGYSDGWRDPNWMDECRQKLAEHIAKGDPRDVAAYCAFLWHHGESTTTAQQPEPEATEGEANVEKLRSAVNLALTYFGMDEDDSNREVFKALREADEQTPTLAAHINRCVTLFGSLRKMADALDMDAGYLSRLRSGEKIEPSAEVLSKLGLRKTVTYSKTNHGIYEATPLIPRTRSA